MTFMTFEPGIRERARINILENNFIYLVLPENSSTPKVKEKRPKDIEINFNKKTWKYLPSGEEFYIGGSRFINLKNSFQEQTIGVYDKTNNKNLISMENYITNIVKELNN